MNYCGVDLHSNNCVVVISDKRDRILYQRQLPNDAELITATVDPHR